MSPEDMLTYSPSDQWDLTRTNEQEDESEIELVVFSD